jgi:hypothetical protein
MYDDRECLSLVSTGALMPYYIQHVVLTLCDHETANIEVGGVDCASRPLCTTREAMSV